jgi:hypothetical protein
VRLEGGIVRGEIEVETVARLKVEIERRVPHDAVHDRERPLGEQRTGSLHRERHDAVRFRISVGGQVGRDGDAVAVDRNGERRLRGGQAVVRVEVDVVRGVELDEVVALRVCDARHVERPAVDRVRGLTGRDVEEARRPLDLCEVDRRVDLDPQLDGLVLIDDDVTAGIDRPVWLQLRDWDEITAPCLITRRRTSSVVVPVFCSTPVRRTVPLNGTLTLIPCRPARTKSSDERKR